MKEERDFAGFVLPFAAGVFVSTSQHTDISSRLPTAASWLFFATALLLAALMHPKFRAEFHVVTRAAIPFLGIFSGLLIGGTSAIMATGYTGPGYAGLTNAAGSQLCHAIDMISFSETDTNSLIKALIAGDKGSIPAHVSEYFRASGASHILALSGFHIGIVYGIASRLLSWMGGHRKTAVARSLITILFCGFYMMITGAGESIVRAFIFILLGEAARLTHRNAATSTILLSAMLIQLMISPASIHSVSFQLSYAAMAGIAYIFPKLKSFWPEEEKDEVKQWRLLRKIWVSAALSVSCQLTTGPLAWLYFDSVPKHFLLTNLIAVPLTGLIIPASLTTLALETLGICPQFLIRFTEGAVGMLTYSLEIIATM